VFSLGVILYELLTGKRPFAAEHAAAALYSIVHETPAPIRSLNPDVPVELASVVERALAKDPRERYDDGREIAQELRDVGRSLDVARLSSSRIPVMHFPRRGRWAWATAGIVAILIGAVTIVMPLWEEPDLGVQVARALQTSLAVMRFENLSDSEDSGRLGEIITELLTTDLSGSEFVTVISSQRLLDLFKQEGVDEARGTDRALALQVARKAGATRMLTGGLSSLRGRQIITAQIVDVATGDVIGSERVDGDDVFAMVDDLAVRIKRRIGLDEAQVIAGDIPVAKATTSNPDAYREYLLGMEQYHALNWDEAQRHFDRALELDSTFTLAYFRKGIAYMTDGREELGFELMARARRFMDNTVGCDKLILQAMAVDFAENHDLEAAERTLKKATIEYPSHKEPFMWLGNFLARGNERDTSRYYLERALELDPNYPFALLILGGRLIEDEAYDEARPVVERYLKVRPNDVVPYVHMGAIFLQNREFDSAGYYYRRAIEVGPDQPFGYQSLGRLFVLMGERDSALHWMGKLLESENVFHRLLGLRSTALVHRVWGEFDLTVSFLQEAVRIADSAGLPNQEATTISTLGWQYYHTDRYDEAVRSFRSAFELDTLALAHFYRMVRVYAMMGQGENALRLVDSVQESWGGRLLDSVEVIENRLEVVGFNALSAGRYQEAIDTFQECRRLAADTTIWRSTLGEAYLLADRYDDAIRELEAYRDAAEIDWPSGFYMRSLYHLADAYVKSGRSRDAIAPLERLMTFWGAADWDVPWMRDAKRLYGSLTAQ
jgi:tetratricopeptide (TPR) repeat protein/TolB-like protein